MLSESLTCTNAGSIHTAKGTDRAAIDGDFAAVAILTAADTCSVLTTVSFNLTTINSEVAAIDDVVGKLFSTADACSIHTAPSRNCAAVDRHLAAIDILTSADSSTVPTAMSLNRTSINSEHTTMQITFLLFTASDACSISAALGLDGTTVDGDISTTSVPTATDSGIVLLKRLSRNVTTVNHQFTHVITAANGRVSFVIKMASGYQLAGILRLTKDVERMAETDLDATSQLCSVTDDEISRFSLGCYDNTKETVGLDDIPLARFQLYGVTIVVFLQLGI